MTPNSEPRTTTPVETAAADPIGEWKVALRQLFPTVFADGEINFPKLRLLLGDTVDEGKERYGLNWAGKVQSMRQLMLPSRGTLAPVEKESVNFAETQHVFVEGENLEVLKLLRKSYAGRVKVIYIDPPYNKDADVIYEDNFEDPLGHYLKCTEQIDEAGNWLTSVTETAGRRHSKWLSMIFPRLLAAKELLHDQGVIFVSIDDHEVHNLRMLMNEVFGEENFVGTICWRNVTDNNPTLIVPEHEYIVVYARDANNLPSEWRTTDSEAKDVLLEQYAKWKTQRDDATWIQQRLREFIADNQELVGALERYKFVDDDGIWTGSQSVHNPRKGGYEFVVLHPRTKKPMRMPANGYRFPEATFRGLEKAGKIIYGEDENRIVQIKKYIHEYEDALRSVLMLDGRLGSYDLKRVLDVEENLFPYTKPVDLLKLFVGFAGDKDAIVLDFFAGAGTSAEAVMRMNHRDNGSRKVLLVQLPEPVKSETLAAKAGFKTIVDLAKARLIAVAKELSTKKGDAKLFQEPAPKSPAGMRFFRLQQSHYKRWIGVTDDDAQRYIEAMALYTDPLLPGWKPKRLLWEVAIKEGYALHSRIEIMKICKDNEVFKVTDPDRGKDGQSFYACFEDKLEKSTITALKLAKDDILIVRDAALNDTLAANLALTCTLKTI
jgi:adenine-specific DNA-methyltransferase